MFTRLSNLSLSFRKFIFCFFSFQATGPRSVAPSSRNGIHDHHSKRGISQLLPMCHGETHRGGRFLWCVFSVCVLLLLICVGSLDRITVFFIPRGGGETGRPKVILICIPQLHAQPPYVWVRNNGTAGNPSTSLFLISLNINSKFISQWRRPLFIVW